MQQGLVGGFRIGVVTLLLVCFTTVICSPVRAFEPTSDPQYVVMNFSTINELNWAAPEPEWQNQIKPQILAQLKELTSSFPAGTPDRRLAWSTLMEYMNFPLDEPSRSSPYVLKIRRMFEIASEVNLPLFIPLNGFQWWDELPELYNWWDPDGTHTPSVFFSRQDNPTDFKRRFIAGYNPDNIWNVEWQDPQTPMNLNWRNWGGGGFRLAPPPNISLRFAPVPRLTYRSVQHDRLAAILTEIVQESDNLAARRQGDLFAGVSIGTEISLNASVTPKDEFLPYGYRAVQDLLCRVEQRCQPSELSQDELAIWRQKAVHAYLVDLTRLASNLGIPKQRLYTHVWAEAEPDDAKYAPYAAAAVTEFSRPGLSLYGYADRPFELTPWQTALNTNGQPAWGAVEFGTDKTAAAYHRALTAMLAPPATSSEPAAKIVVMYNWSEHRQTGALAGIAEVLKTGTIPPPCELPEIVPSTYNNTFDPPQLAWHYLTSGSAADQVTSVLFTKGLITGTTEPKITLELPLASTQQVTSLPSLKPGVYSWQVKVSGCQSKFVTSQPRVIIVTSPTAVLLQNWVRWWLDVAEPTITRYARNYTN